MYNRDWMGRTELVVFHCLICDQVVRPITEGERVIGWEHMEPDESHPAIPPYGPTMVRE